MVDQRFSKPSRLPDSAAFELVFSNPDFRVSNQHFLILGCWSELNMARLGIIVAKKNVGLATSRNRIKRLVREVFRTRKAELGSVDLVVMARKALQNSDNKLCRSSLQALMAEIENKAPKH